MRFVRAVPWHGPVLPFARQRAARVPHSTLPAAASAGKAQRKPRGLPELLSRSALGLENGVSFGAAWHYEEGKGFSLQLDLLPATTGKVVLPQLRPAKNFVLLSSRNGNHAADFVGDECDDPIERGGAHLYAAEQW